MTCARRILTAAAAACALAVVPVRATPLLDFATSGFLDVADSDPYIVGWSFHVSTSIAVDGLGMWDEGADGLDHAHDVGLWTDDAAMTLLATTSIGTGTAEASASSDGQWLFNDIPDLVLGPGDYVLGVTRPAGDTDKLRFDVSGVTTAAGIVYGVPRIEQSGPLTFPSVDFTTIYNTVGLFGPNLRLASAVPEPASLAFLCCGVVGLLGKRRRSRAH